MYGILIRHRFGKEASPPGHMKHENSLISSKKTKHRTSHMLGLCLQEFPPWLSL